MVLVLGVLSAAEAFVAVLVGTQMEQLSSRSVSSRGTVLVRVGTHSLVESLAQFGTGRVAGSGSRGVGTRTRARARPWDMDTVYMGKSLLFSFSVLLIIFFIFREKIPLQKYAEVRKFFRIKNRFCSGYCCLGNVVVKKIVSAKNYQVGK